jgi:hypothetical protein
MEGPDPAHFTYDVHKAPIFYTNPLPREHAIFRQRLNSLTRMYYRLIRLDSQHQLSPDFILSTVAGAITCGELAMIIIRSRRTVWTGGADPCACSPADPPNRQWFSAHG